MSLLLFLRKFVLSYFCGLALGQEEVEGLGSRNTARMQQEHSKNVAGIQQECSRNTARMQQEHSKNVAGA